MATNTKTTDYQLHLKGFVGGYDFDADYVDYRLSSTTTTWLAATSARKATANPR
jgi:hypothetical protein